MKSVTVTKRGSVGDTDFSNSAYACDPDENTCASVEVSGTLTSKNLYVCGFGFNIPDGAVIDSVTYGLKASVSNSNSSVKAALAVCDEIQQGGIGTATVDKSFGEELSVSSTSVTAAQKTYTGAEIQEFLTSTAKSMNYPTAPTVLEYLNDKMYGYYGGCPCTLHLSASGGSIFSKQTCYVYDTYVTVQYTLPDYTVKVQAGNGGTVSGGGTAECGTKVSIKAEADSGYMFLKWSDGDPNAQREITVTGDETLTAEFVPLSGASVNDVYVGTQKVKAVYIGTKKVFG